MAKIDNWDAANAAYWATIGNTIKLQKGYFSFTDREYLLEPMSSKFRRMCYMKGTQGGGSTVEILKSYHGMIFGRLPTGVLYLFPTSDDVYDYSRAIISPLVTANPSVLAKWIKNVKGADSATLKRVNGANLYMRGAGLTKIIEGEGTSTKLQGIPVDRVVFDEIEQMDKQVIRKAIERMGNSTVNEEVYIGNPGVPGRGIDEVFEGSKTFRGSDQRHWFRKCLHCGKEPPQGADWFWYLDYSNGWTCAELAFPGCVKVYPSGKGYIGCMKCGKEVFVRDGDWIPKNKDNSDYMHGYRWSQLTSPNNDPYEILDAFNNPPHGNLTDVCRLKLGMAYVAAEDRLTIGQVLTHCRKGVVMHAGDEGPCAFGMDVGKTCHLVIGKRLDKYRHQIIFVGHFPGLSDWGEQGAVMKRANCKRGIIDARPYENRAREFQRTYRGAKIYLCEYPPNYKGPISYNEKTNMVKVCKTEIMDETHDLVAAPDRLVLPSSYGCPEMQEFAKQVCDPAKSYDEKRGMYIYSGKEDHYRNALNYYLMAAERIGVATVYARQKQKYAMVDNDYDII